MRRALIILGTPGLLRCGDEYHTVLAMPESAVRSVNLSGQ
jgi:hypothetical protein